MAAIWKGSIAFGLVNIPVELRTAVRADHISFRLLHEEDLSPDKVRARLSGRRRDRSMERDRKGIRVRKRQVRRADRRRLQDRRDREARRRSTSSTSCKEEEIDPRYFETPYYLVPAKGAEKSYALLREAIRTTGAVGIGKIIIRQTQHLAGIKVAWRCAGARDHALLQRARRTRRVHISRPRRSSPAGAQDGRAAHRESRRAVRSDRVHRRLPRRI